MPITSKWDNAEKTVVVFTNVGDQKWDEFFVAVKEVNAMIRSVPHDVTLIIDGTDIKSIPPSAMTHFRNALSSLPPNCKQVIGVVTSPFIRAIGNLVQKLSKTNMLSVASLEQARTIAYKDAKQA